MKAQLIAVAVTSINLVLITLVLTQLRPTHAQQAAPVLRAQGLEIVDRQGKITENGKTKIIGSGSE